MKNKLNAIGLVLLGFTLGLGFAFLSLRLKRGPMTLEMVLNPQIAFVDSGESSSSRPSFDPYNQLLALAINDPVHDARIARRLGNLRPVSVSSIRIVSPNWPGVENDGKTILGTSDYVDSYLSESLNHMAYRYAERFNKELSRTNTP